MKETVMASRPTTIPGADELGERARATAQRCGVDLTTIGGDTKTTSPINGEHLHSVAWVDAKTVDAAVERAHHAFLQWRTVPAPVRGALVKRFGELLAEHKSDLATLISLEV
jgi:aldehyde dehydrogenase (NAD+)